MWEMPLIIVIGLAALGYLIIFFIRQSKKKSICMDCPYADECKKHNSDRFNKS